MENEYYQLESDPSSVFRTDIPCPNPQLSCEDCQDCFNEGESIIRPKNEISKC